MFVAKLANCSILKKIVESIKDLVSDINLEISASGINLQAMDSSHVALVTLYLNPEGFESYRCDKPITLGIQISQLSKIIHCGGNDDSITLSNEKEGKMLIKFENSTKKRTSQFYLSLITIDTEHLGIPDTQYGSVIKMPSSLFSKICKDLYSMNETMNIETNEEYIKFSLSNETIGGGIKIEKNDSNDLEDQVQITCDNSINLSFALRYLNMFTKAATCCQQVGLFLSSEYPLMVEYKLDNLGGLKFYLAPRIEENK